LNRPSSLPGILAADEAARPLRVGPDSAIGGAIFP